MSGSSNGKDPDDILTGTTLRVYRFLISENRPLSAREVQRSLKLSSPALAIYHLDKLAGVGIVGKSQEGQYFVETTYLKHYIRLRRFLVPRYLFYAALSTFFIFGWVLFLLIPSSEIGRNFWQGIDTQYGFTLITFVAYGLIMNAVLASFFWYETIRVLRNDKI